jgi:hypothetical protein
VSGALQNVAPMMQHLMNTKLFKMSEETSLAMIKAMQTNAAPATPSPTPASSPAAINPATLWPHVAAIEQLLAPGEAAVVRRYLANASGDQVAHLAREVMTRSVPDGVAWIRAVLADVQSAQSIDARANDAQPSQGPNR